MILTRISSPQVSQKMLDTREAANLWDILRSKYDSIEKHQSFKTMTNDVELKFILDRSLNSCHKVVGMISTAMAKYNVRAPDQNRLASDWPVNTEAIRDEMIAKMLFLFNQEHTENILRAIRTSTTNDSIRDLLITIMYLSIDNQERVFKFLKLKSWVDIPPTYQNTPPEISHSILAATAGQLWDHVNFRYDNIRKTKFYIGLIHDREFKMLVSRGLNKLDRQVRVLEKQSQKYGVPLQKRPPDKNVPLTKAHVISDTHIFRDILQGLQAAMILHSDAYKQCFHNDDIRQIFTDMLFDEIDYYDLCLKYGKRKGWLNAAPLYRSE